MGRGKISDASWFIPASPLNKVGISRREESISAWPTHGPLNQSPLQPRSQPVKTVAFQRFQKILQRG